MTDSVFGGNIEDHRIALRVFEESDIPTKVRWINNSENNAFLHYDIPLNEKKTTLWYRNKDNDHRRDWVITYDTIPVGLIGLLAIDQKNSKAEFYISMGEPAYKRKGIATQASKLVLKYAFDILNLHKVYLNTDAGNIIAHRLFEKVGFTKEGYFVDDMIHNGSFIDRIRYAYINSEE